MTVFVQAFFLIATLLAASYARAEGTEISMVIRPAIQLDSSTTEHDLVLSELVDLSTIPTQHRAEVERHLKAVVLTDRPAIGEERSFTQEGLESIVSEATRRLETAGYAVTWRLPRRSQIFRNIELNQRAVQKKLEQELLTRCNGCEVQLRGFSYPPELSKVNVSELRSWEIISRTERPRGSFAFPIQLDFTNGRRQTVMLSGMVEYWRTLPVLSKALNAGEKILEADVKLERRNVSFFFDEPASMKDLEGAVASRGMQAGEPVTRGLLRREQLVKFGDVVRVQVGGESYSISTEGIAQTAAALGESVQVRVGKNRKLVSGILKEKGLVELQ